MTEPWLVAWQATFDLMHTRIAQPGVGLNPPEEMVRKLIGLVEPGKLIIVEMEWSR